MDRFCRCCWAQEASGITLYNLFQRNYRGSLFLSDIFMVCTNVLLEDPNSGYVCSSCEANLCSFYEFREKCQKLDRQIRGQRIEEIKSQEIIVYDDGENGTEAVTEKSLIQHLKIEPWIESDVKNEHEGDPFSDKATSPPTSSTVVVAPKKSSKLFEFACENCSRSFPTERGLQRHSYIHYKSMKKFKCKICRLQLKDKTTLRRHHINMHSTEMPYECHHCGIRLKTKTQMVRHLRRHVQELSCPFCPRKFQSQSIFASHQVLHMTGNGKKCLLCGEIFLVRRTLEHHLRTVHPKEETIIE